MAQEESNPAYSMVASNLIAVKTQPPLPAPGDVSNCPSPPNIPALNSGPDPDGAAANIFVEADPYDEDCTLYGLSGTTSKLKARDINEITLQDLTIWELEDMLNATNQGYTHLGSATHVSGENLTFEALTLPDEEQANVTGTLVLRSLVKRTRDSGAPLKFCAPGQASIQMLPQTYSGYRTIAKIASKGWITIAKPAICGAIGVASFLTQPANTNFVTEHVFEKQSLRNYIQYMTMGQLPGGGTLTAGKAIVTGVFDATGAYFDSWPATLQQSFGSTPLDTSFGTLGHAESPVNYDNLQVCDADLNAIKARITAGISFLSTGEWAQYGDQQQVDYLSDVIDVFSYMQFGQTVGSYNLAYKALISFWQVFAKHPNAQNGYDYVGAFKQIVNADLNNQVSVAKALFSVYLKDATSTWNDPATTANYATSVVTANQAALKDFATNIAKYVAYNTAGMTA
ncbi:hypothetical protein MMC18_008848 [Xylographa bjoerkii]|nr:hypothetical protein [Xylographa bjoerkii]